MTGAPVPAGADAVVMHEHTRALPDEVEIDDAGVQPGQNLLRKRPDLPRGRPAPAGREPPHPRLRWACWPRSAGPGCGWCRGLAGHRANRGRAGRARPGSRARARSGTRTRSCSRPWRWTRCRAPERPADRPGRAGRSPRLLEQGLEADVLVVTGGVSAGQRDLVPAALERAWRDAGLPQGPAQAGQAALVRRRAAARRGAGVSGLRPARQPGQRPGRVPALHQAGAPRSGGPPGRPAGAGKPAAGHRFVHRGDRPTYHPARRVRAVRGPRRPGVIEILDWAGSADLVGIARADGLAVFPAGDRVFQPGEIVRFLPLG